MLDTVQEAPNTVILAQDEASLYLQATLQLVWHQRGQTPVVKLDPSRKSTHFYGALDLRSGVETAMMSPIMNGATTALFLHKILLTYPHQPILMFWDRAPWHSGPPIHALLEANPRLEIIRFPPGSPDLNPQEHVWKAARTLISHNHRFARLEPLADEFLNYLNQTHFPSSMLDTYGYNQLCPMFI